MPSLSDSSSPRRTHRTFHGGPDVSIETTLGPVGIWLSYRDQFWLQGIGEGRYGSSHMPTKQHGCLRLGGSCIDVYAYVEPDGAGGYRVASLWGNRYFAPRHEIENYRSDRLTRHQVAELTTRLTAVISPVLAAVSPDLIDACHRRSIEADIRDERAAMDYDLRTIRAEISKAQAHYDALRALERSIGAIPTAAPDHLDESAEDLDASLRDVDRLAIGSGSLLALRGAA